VDIASYGVAYIELVSDHTTNVRCIVTITS